MPGPEIESGAANANGRVGGLDVVGAFGAASGDEAEGAAQGLDRNFLGGVAALHQELVQHQRRSGADHQFGAIGKNDLGVATANDNLVIFINRDACLEVPVAARA